MRFLIVVAVLVASCATNDPPKPFVPGDYAATPRGCIEARERAKANGEIAPC